MEGKPGMLNGEINDLDKIHEDHIRPQLLKEFQGQKEIKDNLGLFIKAAHDRGEALDHVFISGPPGLGKTTLAGIISHELGVDLKITSAPALDKPKDLAGLLTTITDKTVFFIDEIHRLKPAIEEMLYIAMEDFELDWVIGQGPSARTVRIPVPPFTLIGATTRPGKVSSPLHTRFGINQRINYYSHGELSNIIQRSADILAVEVSKDALPLLARSCRGTPRVANRLLRRMRDFAQVEGDGQITKDIVINGLDRLKIDPLGLEEIDRDILKTIIEKYSGGPVGAETLAISVGEGIDSLEEFYEPYLIQQGLIKRTPRGRVITSLALDHLGYQNNEDQRLLF